MTEQLDADAAAWRFDGLNALYINCTLKRSPERSHTQGLVDVSRSIMERHGVAVDELRAVDHDIATGVWPDMTEHGWPTDCSSLLNDAGQYAYDGRVGGCLLTGNEDGVKHCAMNVLYSLQHLGYTIPPQADAGWIGEAGPGPSYLDPGSGGPENDFTNRNTTFATWNLMHLGAMLKRAGGIPAHGNQRSEWDAGCRFDFENPEHR
jgi:hypothetical protein